MNQRRNDLSPDDVFRVIAISNHDHLADKEDPVEAFFTTAIEYGERLVAEGLRWPAVIPIPIEVYSLSFSHKDEFPKYGVTNEPPRSGTDLQYMRLYFFSDEAFSFAKRLGVTLPEIRKTITRKELPKAKGAPASAGNKFWDRAS
jgi:hypothetical protein